MTYKIVRFYAMNAQAKETVKTGLTLAEAQAHCADRESASRTCTSDEGLERTRTRGQWFEGYAEE